jgi:hypothetical protein
MENQKRSYRLGDILVRTRRIKPYQLGVALSVQKAARQPLGKILVETRILSALQLRLALLQQRWVRFRGEAAATATPKRFRLYGLELVSRGRELLDRHMAAQQASPAGRDITPELQEVLRLRKELARLRPHQTGRIVEKDHVLKERILTGSL